MISVIIPSYNSEYTISKCIQSLKEQNNPEKFEIILADSSIDNTREIVKKDFPEVKIISFPEKTDPGTARNAGIKCATGDLIVFIDSDCIAGENWLIKHVQYHQKNSDVAAVGGSVLNGNSPKNIVGWSGYFGEFREFLPACPPEFRTHIPTLNISYKRWVFEKYGYFDPNFYPQEDLVFNYNLTNEGEKIFFDPSIKVWHTHRSKLGDFFNHQYKIGVITSQVLKLIPLNGHTIVKNKLLYIFVAPLIPLVKFFRTLVVILKFQAVQFQLKIFSIMLLKIGLMYWFLGFTRGVFAKNSGIRP